MFDDFFTRALIAGIGISLVTGPLGCFVVWRRLSFYEHEHDHSHSADGSIDPKK